MRELAAPRRASLVPWSFRQPLALRSALRRWRGLVGMAVGVGAALSMAMTMLAMVNGSTWLYLGDFATSGADLYLVRSGGTMAPVMPGEGPGVLTDARHRLGQVRALPEVGAAVGLVSWRVERTSDLPQRRQAPERVAVVGVDGDPTGIPAALDLRAGRWLDHGGEVVLGRKLARERGLGVGDVVVLEGRRLAVVGVGQLRGVGLGGDGFAYLGLRTLQELADVGDRVNVVVVDAPDPPAAAARMRATLDGVDVWDRAAVLSGYDAVIARSMSIWRVIIGVSLAVAGIFVSSMLGRAVAERRAELATLRAIGVPARTILALILGEALLTVAAGTVLGVVLSRLIGAFSDRVVEQSLGMDPIYRPDAGTYLAVLAVALGLGLAAAALPARRALQVEPADALREA